MPADEIQNATGADQTSASEPQASPGKPVELDSETNAEIDAAMQAMEQQAKAEARTAGPKHKAQIRGPRVVQAGREQRAGKVVSIGPTDIFVEFGPKEIGVVEKSQFPDKPAGEGVEPGEKELPAVGSEITLNINRHDPSEGIYICSLPGKVEKADWEMLQAGQVVDALATGVNKGGLDMEVAGHRAFLPASQISLERIENLEPFVGQKLTCEVQRVDRRGRGNIVLSRRAILDRERREQAAGLKDSLEVGQTVEGTVRKIMAFGAFVDIGGIDGLVHISDLTHDRVGMGEKAVERFVKPGQSVRVQILKLDWENDRISLGMKQLQEDPFVTASNEIVEGAIVSGRVQRTTDFGAFVEVAPGIEGLVHISELDWKRVAAVEDVVKQGEVISVKVLKVEPDTRKISLSLKQTKDAPKAPAGQGGPGGRGGQGGGQGGSRGPRGKGGERDTRSPEEILQETPAFRRLKEKFGNKGFKGGIM